MIWTNDYEGYSFSQYFILRDGNGTGNWVKIDSVTYGNLSYTDVNAPSANARYLVEAKHPTGCDATLKLKTYNASKSNTAETSIGFDELSSLQQSFIITPNPNMGIFTLQITNDELRRAITEVKIFNVLGEIVYQKPITPVVERSRNHRSPITLKLPAGFYTVRLITDQGVMNKKLIVE